MKKVILTFLCFSLTITGFTIKPSIGLTSQPQDSDTICTIQTYTGSFYTSGFQTGDTVPDFKLYNRQGDSFDLGLELAKGKPVVLIGGSYTCPVFRNKLGVINDIFTNYSSDFNIAIIYAVEAHPDVDNSPYSGTVWVTGQNQSAGILHRQPTTYGERLNIVDSMTDSMSFLPPIFVDGPCNAWWNNYGLAPNNAYIIDTTGVVKFKHGWFDKSPDDIYCDLDSMMGNGCAQQNYGGQFTWQLNDVDADTSYPGDVLSIYGKLINNSSAIARIEIIRMQNNIVEQWGSAICADVCYAEWIDTAYLELAPGDTQDYTNYFYTDPIPNIGNTKIGFRNQDVTNNKFIQTFYGVTIQGVGISELGNNNLQVYPNPSSGIIRLQGLNISEVQSIEVYDLFGRRMVQNIEPKSLQINLPGHAGNYIVSVQLKSGDTLQEICVKL